MSAVQSHYQSSLVGATLQVARSSEPVCGRHNKSPLRLQVNWALAELGLTQLPPQLLHRSARTPPQLGAKMRRLNRAVLAANNSDNLFRASFAKHIFRVGKRGWRQFLLAAHTGLEVRQRRDFLSINRLFYAIPPPMGIRIPSAAGATSLSIFLCLRDSRCTRCTRWLKKQYRHSIPRQNSTKREACVTICSRVRKTDELNSSSRHRSVKTILTKYGLTQAAC